MLLALQQDTTTIPLEVGLFNRISVPSLNYTRTIAVLNLSFQEWTD